MAKKIARSKKSLPIVTFILFVILLGLIAYLTLGLYYRNAVSNPPTQITTSQPANWKTYTNPKYGFTIQYPPTWELTTDNYLNQIEDYILFSIFPGERNGNRLELYKNFQGDFCTGAKTEKTTIRFNNGIEAIKYDCTFEVAINFKKDGENFWLINLRSNTNKNEFDQILSTFKFTDQLSTSPTPTKTSGKTYPETANWQIYTDPIGKFSVKYPPHNFVNETHSKQGAALTLSLKQLYACTPDTTTHEACMSSFNVIIYPDYDGSSRRAWFNEKIGTDLLPNYQTEDVQVDGTNGLVLYNSEQGESLGGVALIPKGSEMYTFYFYFQNAKSPASDRLDSIKRVLSTFQWIK